MSGAAAFCWPDSREAWDVFFHILGNGNNVDLSLEKWEVYGSGLVFLSGSNRADSCDQFLYWCSIRLCLSFCSTDDGIPPDCIFSHRPHRSASHLIHSIFTIHIHFTNCRVSLRYVMSSGFFLLTSHLQWLSKLSHWTEVFHFKVHSLRWVDKT